MRILVTGGCGFIGSNFIRWCLDNYPAVKITTVDILSYAGNPENLVDVEETYADRYKFFKGDISNEIHIEELMSENVFDYIINFAAESHVDRSILDPLCFVKTNIVGTSLLLNAARKHGIKRFLQVSTDEVYGSLGAEGYFTETTPINPSSPYSASKASADLLVLANYHTFKQNVVITRCTNNYGPYQYREKLIPLMITNAIQDKTLPVYGNGTNVRDWIHVIDHCRGIMAALLAGKAGEVYNFGGNCEKTNIDVVTTILKHLNKPASLINYVTDRPGHDLRYAIDYSKATRDLFWEPIYNWEDGIANTVKWYLDNPSW